MEQREIKFRAWDTENGRWVDGAVFGVLGDGDIIRYDHKRTGSGWAVDYSGALKIVRFTGLLDMNGKGIYEGDIVRTFDVEGRVFYEAQEVKILNVYQEIWYDNGQIGAMKNGCEVIGNIWENPELLS